MPRVPRHRFCSIPTSLWQVSPTFRQTGAWSRLRAAGRRCSRQTVRVGKQWRQPVLPLQVHLPISSGRLMQLWIAYQGGDEPRMPNLIDAWASFSPSRMLRGMRLPATPVSPMLSMQGSSAKDACESECELSSLTPSRQMTQLCLASSPRTSRGAEEEIGAIIWGTAAQRIFGRSTFSNDRAKAASAALVIMVLLRVVPQTIPTGA